MPMGEHWPSRFAPDVLRMSFGLSNLNGVDQALALEGDPSRFTATWYGDRRRFRLRRPERDGLPRGESEESGIESALLPHVWDRIREAAVASGAFPFAFPPSTVRTRGGDYGWSSLSPFPQTFSFSDGGMFDNEPIGEAIRLAREADPLRRPSPERVFLLVDASLNRSSHHPSIDPDSPLPLVVRRLFEGLRAEASSREWLKAFRRNDEVDWRDRLCDRFRGLVEAGDFKDKEALIESLRRTGENVSRAGSPRDRDMGASSFAERLERTRALHGETLTGLSQEDAELVSHLIFLLNSTSGLEEKARLNLEVIHTDPRETAGEGLHAFAGFFEQEWREHDYRVGRRKARKLLPRLLNVPEYPAESAVQYEPDRDLSHARLTDVSPTARKAFRDAVVQRTKQLTRTHVRGFPVSWIAGLVAKRKLSELLEL